MITVNFCSQFLNLEQIKLYNTVVTQYLQKLTLNQPLQLLLNVDGVAESEKTFTLLKMCAQIQELTQVAEKQNSVFQTVLTSVVVFNIVEKTLHSLLWLSVKKKKSDLSVVTL